MIAELLRFATVSGICAVIDLGAGLVAINFWGIPVYAAATIGWSGGVVSGYLFHSRWTFLCRKDSGSWASFRLYLGNCVLILLTRWIVIVLAGGFDPRAEFVLVLAVVSSFALNYFVSRVFIFR